MQQHPVAGACAVRMICAGPAAAGLQHGFASRFGGPNLLPPSRPPAPARRPPLRQASGPPPPQNPLPPRHWAGTSATTFRPSGRRRHQRPSAAPVALPASVGVATAAESPLASEAPPLTARHRAP